ncbi:MAG: 2,3-diphosphoglycerate-dependent phosphoglycerate mutase [Candidatus Paceibacterota bacterium]|jgi:2,3-bisphosphoglycerate-dependent phosphoglycerate mutase
MKKIKYKVVFVRHGESIWNKADLFTGWVDCGLTERGIKDAKATGKLLKEKKYFFDYAFTSVLKKAIKTLDVILEEMDLMWIPVEKSWNLNERHYGNLIGKNKNEILKKFGEEQFMKWRRGYDTPPPPIKKTNPYYKLQSDPRYKEIKVPKTECPKDVMKRVIPYWEKNIIPKIKSGKKIIVAAHGNSLRSLIKYFDNIPNKEMLNLNIPTGIPFVYEFDKNMKPIRHYYLGDKNKVARAIEEVKNQGRK